jgi:hypothetical protein
MNGFVNSHMKFAPSKARVEYSHIGRVGEFVIL